MNTMLRSAACAFVLAAMFGMTGIAGAEDQVKEAFHPTVNGSPVTLMQDNMLSQAIGQKGTNLDMWVGEFFQFDDNIYNSKSGNRKSDAVFSTAAGFKFKDAQPDVWSLDFEGQMQYNAYSDRSYLNGFEGFFKGKGTVDFSPALSARLSAGYSYSYDNDSIVEDIIGIHHYNAGAGVTLRPSPYAGMDIDYAFSAQNRNEDKYDYQDFTEHSVSIRPYWEMTDSTTVYFRAGMSSVKYDENWNNDATSFGASLGLSWSYRDTAKAYVEAGVKHWEFDSNGAVESRDSVTRPSLSLGADLALNSDWKTGATFNYAPAVSGTSLSSRASNYVDRYLGAVFLQYSPGAGRFTAKVTPFYCFNKPDNDQEYEQYGTNFGVSYSITEWLNVSAGYTYTVLDYEKSGRRDRNRVTCGVAATF